MTRIPNRPGLQKGGVSGVQRRVLSMGGVEGVEAGGEGGAVGDPDGVGPGERHHLVERQALHVEVVSELGGAEERRREVLHHLRAQRHAPVSAPRGHVVPDVAGHEGAVAGRKGKNVRARHCFRADGLDHGLRLVDHLVAYEAGVVDRAVFLCNRFSRDRV